MIKRLLHWVEVSGPLLAVQIFEDHVLAQIGEITVILPPELEKKLRPLIGTRIGILRTDIIGKEYLFRAIPEELLEG